MPDWEALQSYSLNLITAALVLTVLVSTVQGLWRGASGSAHKLMTFVAEGAATVLSLIAAWKLADMLSPAVESWLVGKAIIIPNEEIGALRQLYYTFITGIRDFPLLRFGTLYIVVFLVCKQLLYQIWLLGVGLLGSRMPREETGQGRSWISSFIGASIGALIGCGRALLLIGLLFVYTSLFPHSPFTQYVQSSDLYTRGATQVFEPFSGNVLEERLPVFAKAVEKEFSLILQRKYEVLDARIPDDIALAAKQITEGKQGDEAKARALYDWVGSRVKYDWDKVELYEQKRIWKEQTPEETFATRTGVCIDYSRLYAVMARSVGLDVKVVTGLGYDGRGGYGPHAWNTVYLQERNGWVPLDATWASSGGNWFDPPNFDRTHIPEA